MKERFRAVNKISKHKMSLLWDRALACFYKEHAVVKAIKMALLMITTRHY